MYSDNDYDENGDSKQRMQAKRRKSRTKDFSDEEKRTLAALIRKEEHLWDCSSRSSSAAVDKTWARIAIQMGKPKDKCKLAWIALRESYRYHERTSRKSSDPLGQNRMQWEFAKDLSFLANAKSIYPYIEVSNEDAMDTSLEQDGSSAQSYIVKEENRASADIDDYLKDSHENNSELNMSDESQNGQDTTDFDGYVKKQNIKKLDSLKASNGNEMGDLIYQLGKLVNAQTEFMRHFGGNSSETLAYQTQLTACDSLLQQLPKKIAETTLVEIQNYILKKINEQQKHKTNN